MHGKTVGVIGTGKIGAICAKILAGFGCKVLLSDIYHNPELVAQGRLVMLHQKHILCINNHLIAPSVKIIITTPTV